MNKYSPCEFWKNIYSFIMTKIYFKQARLIRRPIYIRGRRSIVGADNLTTGRFCRFDLDGDKQTLFIGENCQFGDFTHIVAHEYVSIGNNVLIASKVFISDSSHGIYTGTNQDSPISNPMDRTLITQKVSIGDNVWIGENVVILLGVEIGSGCIIGANSTITKDIPKCSIVVGNNRIIKKYNENKSCWEEITK